MFGIFNRDNKVRDKAHQLFTLIVEQARSPYFYTEWQVADTLDGRFDLIILHLSLVINRLEETSSEDKQVALMVRYLQEVLFDNMDMSLRELGVGDMSVGKKVKIMAEAYYGRKAAYAKAIHSGEQDQQLRQVIMRNIYRESAPEEGILEKFTSYVAGQEAVLSAQSEKNILSGAVNFKDMGSF